MGEPLEFQLDCVEDEIAILDIKRSRLIRELVAAEMEIKRLKSDQEYLLCEIENQASA